MAIWEFIAIDLIFNVRAFDSWVGNETSHINFVIEMANIANNSIVFHLCHITNHDDLVVSSSSNKDIRCWNHTRKSLYFETFHAGLKRTDWITLCNNNTSSTVFHGLSASLAYISVSTYNNLLSSNHHVCSTHKSIWKGMSASINVIELLLGHTIINIDCFE